MHKNDVSFHPATFSESNHCIRPRMEGFKLRENSYNQELNEGPLKDEGVVLVTEQFL